MSHTEETDRSNGRREATSEREIRELLLGAGQRESIPEDRHARLEAAARSAWEELAAANVAIPRRSPLPRVAAIAAALVLAVLAGWIVMTGRRGLEPVQVATVELEAGAEAGASMDPQGEAGFDIAAGDALLAGVRLTTPGGERVVEGRLALRMVGGEGVRLDAGSTVRLLSGSRLELESGAVYVDSWSAPGAYEPLEIVTPYGIVRHVGTQYEVRLDDSTVVLVRVREGAVSVRNNGDSWAAREGEELALLSDGSVTRGTVEADAWLWTLDAAPAVEIEGMTLADYLGWVIRETGWQLEYERSDLAARAGEIVLHGTIVGLRPDESLNPIVEGSGLVHSVEDGVLRISRP
jgi:hypothetical protein